VRSTQEPKLWYGIGILYDRYGSLEHAEEAFSQVMLMAPAFEKANEIYFRLGIIYKQQKKYQQSLEVCRRVRAWMAVAADRSQCFRYILANPPSPLTEEDIWFQIGHVYEQNTDVCSAVPRDVTPPNLAPVRERQAGVQASARPKSRPCQGPPAARLAASPGAQPRQPGHCN
jgi:tetratricopeptide (TPR) repeat protein